MLDSTLSVICACSCKKGMNMTFVLAKKEWKQTLLLVYCCRCCSGCLSSVVCFLYVCCLSSLCLVVFVAFLVFVVCCLRRCCRRRCCCCRCFGGECAGNFDEFCTLQVKSLWPLFFGGLPFPTACVKTGAFVRRKASSV